MKVSNYKFASKTQFVPVATPVIVIDAWRPGCG